MVQNLKRVLSITFLNFFISGGLVLIIPLLLLQRNIDLVEISIILSILPLIFLGVRIAIATLADLKGWSKLYLLINAPSSIIAIILYTLAHTTTFFLIGKIVEAIKESSYWGVIRTAIFTLKPTSKGKQSTKNIAILSLATALGSATAGIGITYLGFPTTLIILILASLLITIPASLLWKIPIHKLKCKPKDLLNPKNRNKKFWSISIIIIFYSLARYPLLYLLLPAFMAEELGYTYITIGITYMFYNFVTSTATFAGLKTSLNQKRVILQSIIALIASFLLINSKLFIILFISLALVDGLVTGFFEAIIAKATTKSLSISVDIGFLHIPMRFAEFVSILFAGYIAQNIGYQPIFILSGISYTIFSILSFYFLKSTKT
jgi:MFS family permease